MRRLLTIFALLLSVVAAYAQIPLTGAGRGTPGGGAAVFATYTQTDNPAAQATPGTSTVTFTAVNIGTAVSNRVVVITFTNAGVIATAMTIGGVNATKAVEESSRVSSLQIWYATVPSGTTANVVISFPSNPTNCILVAGNFNSGASTTPANTQTGQSALSNTQVLNTTIPTSGFGVMGIVTLNGVETPTWINMTNVGGDTTTSSNDGSSQITLYTAHSITAGSPTTLTGTLTTPTQIHSVSVSWGP